MPIKYGTGDIMFKSPATLLFVGLAAVSLAGCSSDGGLLGGAFTTQSIGTVPTNAQTAAAAPKVDPACYALSQRIDMLRKDGLTDRLEKASVGKSSTVSVKRTSLAQAAELDKANAEFQAKCSTFGPRPVQAAAAPAAAITTGSVANSAQVVQATAPPVVQQPSR